MQGNIFLKFAMNEPSQVEKLMKAGIANEQLFFFTPYRTLKPVRSLSSGGVGRLTGRRVKYERNDPPGPLV